MIVSGRFQSVFQSRSVFQSNLKQVQKKFVDYANATNAEFIIDPKVLFHGWWIYSHLHISWSSECQGSVQVGSLTTSWYDHIACILACVAWRFCRVGRRSGVAAKFGRTSGEAARKITPAPISSRFLCPRPPLLLSAPNQNRHATQAKRIQHVLAKYTAFWLTSMCCETVNLTL